MGEESPSNSPVHQHGVKSSRAPSLGIALTRITRIGGRRGCQGSLYQVCVGCGLCNGGQWCESRRIARGSFVLQWDYPPCPLCSATPFLLSLAMLETVSSEELSGRSHPSWLYQTYCILSLASTLPMHPCPSVFPWDIVSPSQALRQHRCLKTDTQCTHFGHVSLEHWKPTVIPLDSWGGPLFVLGSKEPQDGVNWAEIATVFSWSLSLLTALEFIFPLVLFRWIHKVTVSFHFTIVFMAAPAWH